MRGKLAKKLRREIFGDTSLRTKRRYGTATGTTTRVNMGLRAAYQQLKKSVYAHRRRGEVLS